MDKQKVLYLNNNALRAMSNTLMLAANVLGFQLVELWFDGEDGKKQCAFVYAAEDILQASPTIVTGYYPEYKKQHILSPKICEFSRISSNKCYWENLNEQVIGELHLQTKIKFNSAMGYMIENSVKENGPSIFIVAYSTEINPSANGKIRFLGGLGIAISVAAFEFIDETEQQKAHKELDAKSFDPKKTLTPVLSSSCLNKLNELKSEGLGVWGRNLSDPMLSNYLVGSLPKSYNENMMLSSSLIDKDAPTMDAEDEYAMEYNLYQEQSHSNNHANTDKYSTITVTSSIMNEEARSIFHREMEVTEEHKQITARREDDNHDGEDQSQEEEHQKPETEEGESESNIYTMSEHSMIFDMEDGGQVPPPPHPPNITSSPHDITTKVPPLMLPTLPLTSANLFKNTQQYNNHSTNNNSNIHNNNNTHHSSMNHSHSTNNNSNQNNNSSKINVPTIPPLPLHTLQQPVAVPSSPLPQEQPHQAQEDTKDNEPAPLTTTTTPTTIDTSRSHTSQAVADKFDLSIPPTWEPPFAFSYPVGDIPAKHRLIHNLSIEHFSHIQHIADGSNANVFMGIYQSEKVIIKMIKEQCQHDPVAVHEFDVEHGMLCRIQHPNIVKIIGAGIYPRRFVVLEWLGGGTLSSLLQEYNTKPGLASRLFRKPTFTYMHLLQRARELADALDYLHTKCHIGATIIHRDLKPDNIGFTSTGVMKIFDFGLSTCVRTRHHVHDAYAMTGYTGSLRYMAPETAECAPYTEKVDVYSFGILIWQMARDRVPFKDMNKNEFFALVIHGQERPKIDPSWPMGFSSLLTRCWQKDPLARPSFAQVMKELDGLIHANHMITLATVSGHTPSLSPMTSPTRPLTSTTATTSTTASQQMPPSPIQQNTQQQIQQMHAYTTANNNNNHNNNNSNNNNSNSHNSNSNSNSSNNNQQVPVERNRSYTVPYNNTHSRSGTSGGGYTGYTGGGHSNGHGQDTSSTSSTSSVFVYGQPHPSSMSRKVTPPPLQLSHLVAAQQPPTPPQPPPPQVSPLPSPLPQQSPYYYQQPPPSQPLPQQAPVVPSMTSSSPIILTPTTGKKYYYPVTSSNHNNNNNNPTNNNSTTGTTANTSMNGNTTNSAKKVKLSAHSSASSSSSSSSSTNSTPFFPTSTVTTTTLPSQQTSPLLYPPPRIWF